MQPLSSACLIAATLAAAANAQHSLLFTPSANEVTKSGSAGAYVRNLGPNAISVVTPNAAITHSAEKFAADWNYQTLAGDTDVPADGFVSHIAFMGGINALTTLPYQWNEQTQTFEPRTRPVTVADAYITPRNDVGYNVSAPNQLRKGDCGRFVRNAAGNGQVEYFITAEQIITAFGMFDPQSGQPLEPEDIALDAIAVSLDQHIYLSFEDDHWMRLFRNGALNNFFVPDGSVVCLRNPVWDPNTKGEVAVVQANRGIVVLSEPQVDAMLVNSNAADNAGANPPAITDLDGLAIDRDGGGVLVVQWGNQVFNLNHLLLSGTTMTGCGVISTVGGGTIAVVNGCALAATAPTPSYGRRMGLQWTPAPGAQSSVENLDLLETEPSYFVLATPTPGPGTLPGAFTVHVGTNVNPVAVVLLYGIGALPVSPSADPATMPLIGAWFANNRCFPEYYPGLWPAPFGTSPFPMLLTAGVGMAAAGTGQFGQVALAGPNIAGGILFQALAIDAAGNLHLSTPGTIN